MQRVAMVHPYDLSKPTRSRKRVETPTFKRAKTSTRREGCLLQYDHLFKELPVLIIQTRFICVGCTHRRIPRNSNTLYEVCGLHATLTEAMQMHVDYTTFGRKRVQGILRLTRNAKSHIQDVIMECRPHTEDENDLEDYISKRFPLLFIKAFKRVRQNLWR
ncbi:hypothetical protein Tco_1462775 [Tanacetum coccineum]